MLRFIVWRLAQNVVVFFLFLTVVFFLFQAMPGDYTKQFIMNPKIPPEAREALAERLGLSGTVWDQYIHYIRNVFTGNLGVSFEHYPREVWDIVAERLPRTAVLFFTATLVAFSWGFPLGKYIAWKRGSVGDYAATVTGVLFYTIFTPLLAIILLFVFANQLGWFRSGGFLSPRFPHAHCHHARAHRVVGNRPPRDAAYWSSPTTQAGTPHLHHAWDRRGGRGLVYLRPWALRRRHCVAHGASLAGTHAHLLRGHYAPHAGLHA